MRAVASDYDGTLNFDGSFKEEDIQSIKQFQQEGNYFGLCTGRPLIGVIQDKEIDYDFYIMSSGAVIYNKELQVIYENAIPKHVAEAIVKSYQETYDLFIQADQNLYLLKEAESPIETILIDSLDAIPQSSIYSISINGKDEDHARKLCQFINTTYPEIIAFQNIQYIDIVRKGCSKGKGIQLLKQLLSLDQIVSIGDSYNDIPMLKAADLAFTFHHSPEIVKQHANHFVSSISECIERMNKKSKIR